MEDFKHEGNWYDVGKRYRDILKIVFTLAIVDFGRSFIMILAVLCKSRSLANLYQALFFNDLLGFVAIVILLIFRLQMAGRICAGDLTNSKDGIVYPYSGKLIEDQGAYLLALIAYFFVAGFFLCFFNCVLVCNKLFGDVQKVVSENFL